MQSKDLVKGKSINELLEMDISRMSMQELRAVTTRLNSAANKRVKSLVSKGINSPALRALGNMEKFSIKSAKSQSELRVALYRVNDFLKNETSTVIGYKKVRSKTITALQNSGVTNVTPQIMDEMFSVFEKLKELDPSIESKTVKYNVLSEIVDLQTSDNISAEELLQRMIQKRDRAYEERIEYYNEQFKNPFELSYDDLFDGFN